MQYTYCFANTSLVLRLMTYLSGQLSLDLMSVTVIYLVDRWIVRIKLSHELLPPLKGNFLSFLKENGYAFKLSAKDCDALAALDLGVSVADVASLYSAVIVSHGELHPEDIEAFFKKFVCGLGYCPPSLT